IRPQDRGDLSDRSRTEPCAWTEACRGIERNPEDSQIHSFEIRRAGEAHERAKPAEPRRHTTVDWSVRRFSHGRVRAAPRGADARRGCGTELSAQAGAAATSYHFATSIVFSSGTTSRPTFLIWSISPLRTP